MIASVFIHPEKQASIKRGHPWIYPKAIARYSGILTTGALVQVFSLDNELLAVGVYNEHSLYRVRVLVHAFESLPRDSLESIVSARIQQALHLRNMLQLPNAATSAFRLFNSEGDGLSGLTIDRFNQTCVVSSSAYWVEAHREMISQVLLSQLEIKQCLWFSQEKPLAQDGWTQAITNQAIGTEVILESGIQFQVDFTNTQKTGLFLDQRENHQRIAALASGKRVLDLYTYTGGFALHAAKAQAAFVTAVDSSAAAIALAKRNAELNQLSQIEFITADARDYLSQAGQYDLVILDPPKLVPSYRHAEKAKNYYRFLHRETFKYLASGSLLMTCNCSAALSATAFTELVCSQAVMVGKVARVVGVFGPSSCHPTLAAFPEGQYLTAVLLSVS